MTAGKSCPIHPPLGTKSLGPRFQHGAAAAVRRRSGGICERDGCDRPARYVDHIRPRVLRRDDSLDNLAHLCPHHHGLKTRAENNP